MFYYIAEWTKWWWGEKQRCDERKIVEEELKCSECATSILSLTEEVSTPEPEPIKPPNKNRRK
jgi:hypothetical protein